MASFSAGLYVHIPFCNIQCGYCDFFTLQNRKSQFQPYLNALTAELNLYADDDRFRELRFDTVFLGGGTPSLLNPTDIATLLAGVRKLFDVSPEAEITIEANPGTLDSVRLVDLKSAGVNRLSLGAQSFDAAELAFLDRDHSAADTDFCLAAARAAGYDNVSLDLIYGLPGQTISAWQDNLDAAVALAPDHLSVYCLTFEPRTPLMHRLRKGEVNKPEDASVSDMQLLTADYLEEHGYTRYEISNYAKPGFESRHNKKYWNGAPYLGVGASAHSFVAESRFWNVRNYKGYMDSLSQNELAIAGQEVLSREQRCLERIFLGLRQQKGLDLQLFRHEFGESLLDRYAAVMRKHFPDSGTQGASARELEEGARKVKGQYLLIEDGYLRLTREALPLCDSLCAEFA